jgi:hypothetical protein
LVKKQKILRHSDQPRRLKETIMTDNEKKLFEALLPFAAKYKSSPNMWREYEVRRGLDSKVWVTMTVHDLKHAAEVIDGFLPNLIDTGDTVAGQDNHIPVEE